MLRKKKKKPEISQFGVFHQAAKKYRAEYHQHNSES